MNGNSLGEDLLTLGLSLSLQSVILADSSLEGLSALALTNVLNSDVNSLGDDSASVLLVDNDSNSVLSDIEHTTGLTVVELVGHTLVNATVGYDIDEIALLVSLHDLGEVDGTVLSEGL